MGKIIRLLRPIKLIKELRAENARMKKLGLDSESARLNLYRLIIEAEHVKNRMKGMYSVINTMEEQIRDHKQSFSRMSNEKIIFNDIKKLRDRLVDCVFGNSSITCADAHISDKIYTSMCSLEENKTSEDNPFSEDVIKYIEEINKNRRNGKRSGDQKGGLVWKQ